MVELVQKDLVVDAVDAVRGVPISRGIMAFLLPRTACM